MARYNPPRHAPHGDGLRCSKCGELVRHHRPRKLTAQVLTGWVRKVPKGVGHGVG